MHKLFSIALLLLVSTVSFGNADTRAPFGYIDSPAPVAKIGSDGISMPGIYTQLGFHDIEGRVEEVTNLGFWDEGSRVGQPPSGLDWVRVQVLRDINGQRDYWDGEKFQSQPRWIEPILFFLPGFFQDRIRWLLPDVDFTVVGVYEVRLAAQDIAGNRARPTDNDINFIQTVEDNIDPVGTFVDVDPCGRQFGENLLHPYRIVIPGQPDQVPGEVISVGTKEIRIQAASQFMRATEIRGLRVLYQVYHVDSNEFWNGTGWQSSPAWRRAGRGVDRTARNVDFDYDYFSDVDFDRVGDYWVRMNLSDTAGNISTGAESEKILVRVVQETPAIARDRTAPTAYSLGNIYKTLEPDGTVQVLGLTTAAARRDLTGAATDTGIGVNSVLVQIERRAGGRVSYWHPFITRDSGYWASDRVWFETVGHLPSGLIRTATDIPWRVRGVDMLTPGEYITRVAPGDFSGNRSTAQQNPISFYVVE